jgi:uncharacterized protein (DUF488 family)
MLAVSTPRRFFTIGHSTRPIDVFVELLQSQSIDLVVDVRTIQRSRANPQYNSDRLGEALTHHRIGYEQIAALGGLRSKRREVPADLNAFWRNRSFHNYADYAMSAEFASGLQRLRDLGRSKSVAVMCAEVLWWRCHRRIISDYLIAAGDDVFHILDQKHVECALMTKGARLLPNGTLVYPTPKHQTKVLLPAAN